MNATVSVGAAETFITRSIARPAEESCPPWAAKLTDMTRPKRPAQKKSGPQRGGQQPSSGKPAAMGGRGPKKNTARGRDGTTRDTARVAREPSPARSEERPGERSGEQKPSDGRRYGSASTRKGASSTGRTSTGRTSTERSRPPRTDKKKALPELKRVQLQAPPPDTEFRDRDGQKLTFPDSNLRRVAAQILTEKRKAWRYRPFNFPLFTDKGHEQAFHFDFYIYDAEDSVIRLILVVASESREVWDKIGRFKRQYPMYTYELWTPEKLHQLSGPRGKLGW